MFQRKPAVFWFRRILRLLVRQYRGRFYKLACDGFAAIVPQDCPTEECGGLRDLSKKQKDTVREV